MIWGLALAVFAVITAGAYLATSRDLLRCLIGLTLLGNGINLLLFGSGRLQSGQPPIIDRLATELVGAANPLPQALTLTAIVISFALLCFSLALGIRLLAEVRGSDLQRLRAAEPPASDPLKPPLEEAP
ncbi:MAG: NADH-quinone oxidoreductase subunit K [Desulfuromonadales bacterium]|nr:NADH-quinone oxidoreductase subunit K [Desulfuromonadales bacterium]